MMIKYNSHNISLKNGDTDMIKTISELYRNNPDYILDGNKFTSNLSHITTTIGDSIDILTNIIDRFRVRTELNLLNCKDLYNKTITPHQYAERNENDLNTLMNLVNNAKEALEILNPATDLLKSLSNKLTNEQVELKNIKCTRNCDYCIKKWDEKNEALIYCFSECVWCNNIRKVNDPKKINDEILQPVKPLQLVVSTIIPRAEEIINTNDKYFSVTLTSKIEDGSHDYIS